VGNYVKHSRHGEFTVQDVKAALICDKVSLVCYPSFSDIPIESHLQRMFHYNVGLQVLCDLFKLGDTGTLDIMEEQPLPRNSLSYNEVIK